MKRCITCEQQQPLTDFPRRRDSPDGYRNECKDCRRVRNRESMRQWRKTNPERDLANAQSWRERNRESERERHLRYDEAHREQRRLAIAKSRAENPEHHRALMKRWRERNPETARAHWRAYQHRRRAGVITDPRVDAYAEWLLLQPCAYCGTTENITIDHIVPLSRGGRHEANNLAPACQPCNSSKNNRLLSEWEGRQAA